MNDFTIHGTGERFENSHADVREEVRLMALADREGAEHAALRPVADAPRRSLLRRLFTRPATRLAA